MGRANNMNRPAKPARSSRRPRAQRIEESFVELAKAVDGSLMNGSDEFAGDLDLVAAELFYSPDFEDIRVLCNEKGIDLGFLAFLLQEGRPTPRKLSDKDTKRLEAAARELAWLHAWPETPRRFRRSLAGILSHISFRLLAELDRVSAGRGSGTGGRPPRQDGTNMAMAIMALEFKEKWGKSRLDYLGYIDRLFKIAYPWELGVASDNRDAIRQRIKACSKTMIAGNRLLLKTEYAMVSKGWPTKQAA